MKVEVINSVAKTFNTRILFSILNIIKLAHWCSEKYSTHTILDDFYKDLGGLFDELVETILSDDNFNVVYVEKKGDIKEFAYSLERLVEEVKRLFEEFVGEEDDLPESIINIVDDIYTSIAQYSYKLLKVNG